MKPITARAATKAASGHNRYCGPAALSALTGIDTEQAARLLRDVSGRRAIKGVHNSELLAALDRLGYLAVAVPVLREPTGAPTLARWAKLPRASDPYLVVVTGHYCVIQGRTYMDNLAGRVPLRKAPKRRARVRRVWRIVRTSQVRAADVVPAKPPRKADPERGARAAVAKLAKLHNIEAARDFGIESRMIYVIGGNWLDEESDPFAGDHYVDTWAEALERVRAYVAIAPAVAAAA